MFNIVFNIVGFLQALQLKLFLLSLNLSEMICICFAGNMAYFYYTKNMVRVDPERFIYIKILDYFNNFINIERKTNYASEVQDNVLFFFLTENAATRCLYL